MYSGQNQIVQVGTPEFITMQVGGNEMGFFDIAINCIYQPDNAENYDPQYDQDPNCQGACCQAIQSSQNNIDNTLNRALTTTLEEIPQTSNVGKAEFFYLYLTGYVHFFNVDTTWYVNSLFRLGSSQLLFPCPRLSLVKIPLEWYFIWKPSDRQE